MPIEHIVRCEICGDEAPAIEPPGGLGRWHDHPLGWSELTIQAEPTKSEKKDGRKSVRKLVTLCPVHTLRATGN